MMEQKPKYKYLKLRQIKLGKNQSNQRTRRFLTNFFTLPNINRVTQFQ